MENTTEKKEKSKTRSLETRVSEKEEQLKKILEKAERYKQQLKRLEAQKNEKDRKEVETFLEKTLEKDGITFKGKGYDVPASLKGVIAVSSTGPTNELSLFSNYGKNIVDIAAPGGDYRLFEKYGFEKWLDESLIGKEHVLSTSPDGAYYYAAGTSVAAPKVSGTLALIIEKDHLKDQPTKSEKILYKYGVNKEIPKNKGDFGNGILDVYNALSY